MAMGGRWQVPLVEAHLSHPSLHYLTCAFLATCPQGEPALQVQGAGWGSEGGLAGAGTSHADAKGPLSPQEHGCCWFCQAGSLWVFSWYVAGPCWFSCLMLYLLWEGSFFFFKLYIYKKKKKKKQIIYCIYKNLKMVETCMNVLSSTPLYLFLR